MKHIARVAAVMLGVMVLSAPAARAADRAKSGTADEGIRWKEPMSGGMKREGMMKEDVRIHAEKKNKMMQEAMEREAARKESAKKQ